MNPKPVPDIDLITRPFWDAVQRRTLELQRCDDCAAWIFYPNEWCTSCYGRRLSWRAVSGRGSVYTFSVVHQPPFAAFAAEVPYVLATIELDEGPHMMTNVVNCAPDGVYIGLPVTVCFEDRNGFLVPQFEPAAGS